MDVHIRQSAPGTQPDRARQKRSAGVAYSGTAGSTSGFESRDRLALGGVNHIEVDPPLESEDKVAEAEKAREVAKRT